MGGRGNGVTETKCVDIIYSLDRPRTTAVFFSPITIRPWCSFCTTYINIHTLKQKYQFGNISETRTRCFMSKTDILSMKLCYFSLELSDEVLILPRMPPQGGPKNAILCMILRIMLHVYQKRVDSLATCLKCRTK